MTQGKKGLLVLHSNSKGPNASQVAKSKDYLPKYCFTVFLIDFGVFFLLRSATIPTVFALPAQYKH